jgi:hypothetical protein
MLWILNQNLCKEEGYAKLLTDLERFDMPHVKVKPVPFTDRLLPLDYDTSKASLDISELPEPEIDTTQDIWVMGSYTLCKIANKRGWKPGCYLNNLSYDVWSKAWAPIDLLNPYAQVTAFKDAVMNDKAAFIRPVADS